MEGHARVMCSLHPHDSRRMKSNRVIYALKNAKKELEDVWQGVTMQFNWKFDEKLPSPGDTEQRSIVDADSLNMRLLYAKVLAEPMVVTSGYHAPARALGSGQGGAGESEHDPPSVGFTALLSNGDEMLTLAEHCRVVIDSIVDAPSVLLTAENIHDAALHWQRKISWFQV